MRICEKLETYRLILHHLDVNPQISDHEIDLATNPKLVELVKDHIQGALKDSAARSASFDPPPHEISTISNGILSGSHDFVDGSKTLARCLHTLMQEDKRISAGDLIVCLYGADDSNGLSPYLALMKVDTGHGLQRKYVQMADRSHAMKITVLENLLPTKRERLQKCACIRKTGQDYDMILIDRQKRSQTHTVANFFTEKFLKAHFALNDEQQTTSFYDCASRVHNNIREQLTVAENEQLRQYIRDSLKRRSITVEEWTDELPLIEQFKAIFQLELAKEVVDGRIEVDKRTATRLLKKAQWFGSHGLKVEFDEFFNPIIEAQEVHRPGEIPKWRITLETEDWKPKQ